MIDIANSIRVVIDTNVLLRALANASSQSRRLINLCDDRRIVALLSKPLVDEYRRVLVHLTARDESISAFQIEALLRRLIYVGEYVRKTHVTFNYHRDPADAKLIELAIEARATHIVSFDLDLLSLPTSRSDAGKRFRQRLRDVAVLTPVDFFREYPVFLRRT